MYAGSFDPFTLGHLDIVERASEIYDEVIIAVSENVSKKSLFDIQEKMEMIEQVLNHSSKKNIQVIKHTGGLTVSLAKELEAKVLIRGIRSVKDMEYEMDIASMNKTQAPSIETVFLMADEKYRFVSSSLIKEVAKFEGNLDGLVPEIVINRMKKFFK